MSLHKLSQLYEFLGSSSGGLLIFGIINRGLLLVAALSLASLAVQIRGLAGTHGQTPARKQLHGFYRDFGTRALLYWPTVLWPSMLLPEYLSDLVLVALPSAAAVVAGLGALAGGMMARVGAAGALVSLLSIDAIHAIVYPWDSLLIESLWILQAFPALPSVWTDGIGCSSLPLPVVAFGTRLLVARLLLGFGLLKFAAAGRGDHHYIKHFLIAQPMVSPAGFALHGLMPNWAWRAALLGSELCDSFSTFVVCVIHLFTCVGMWSPAVFVVEVPLPIAALIAPASWGLVRVFTATSIIGLMAGM
jgi:hypothetical protein